MTDKQCLFAHGLISAICMVFLLYCVADGNVLAGVLNFGALCFNLFACFHFHTKE